MSTESPNPLMLCRVCGYDLGYFPWGESGRYNTYQICDCCGCEAGYEDTFPGAARMNREAWIAKGAPWFSPKERPANWSLEEQLQNLRYITDDLWKIE